MGARGFVKFRRVQAGIEDAVVLADGLDIMRLSPGVSLTITKNKDSSKFWHPEKDYNYLETLRTKLGWHRQD